MHEKSWVVGLAWDTDTLLHEYGHEHDFTELIVVYDMRH
jgi:hypothetical protein